MPDAKQKLKALHGSKKEQKNEKQKLSVRFLTESVVIAALYAAATYLSAAFSLAYGPVQFRLSEAPDQVSTSPPLRYR